MNPSTRNMESLKHMGRQKQIKITHSHEEMKRSSNSENTCCNLDHSFSFPVSHRRTSNTHCYYNCPCSL